MATKTTKTKLRHVDDHPDVKAAQEKLNNLNAKLGELQGRARELQIAAGDSVTALLDGDITETYDEATKMRMELQETESNLKMTEQAATLQMKEVERLRKGAYREVMTNLEPTHRKLSAKICGLLRELEEALAEERTFRHEANNRLGFINRGYADALPNLSFPPLAQVRRNGELSQETRNYLSRLESFGYPTADDKS